MAIKIKSESKRLLERGWELCSEALTMKTPLDYNRPYAGLVINLRDIEIRAQHSPKGTFPFVFDTKSKVMFPLSLLYRVRFDEYGNLMKSTGNLSDFNTYAEAFACDKLIIHSVAIFWTECVNYRKRDYVVDYSFE